MPSVLIVDDEPNIRRMVGALLRRAGEKPAPSGSRSTAGRRRSISPAICVGAISTSQHSALATIILVELLAGETDGAVTTATIWASGAVAIVATIGAITARKSKLELSEGLGLIATSLAAAVTLVMIAAEAYQPPEGARWLWHAILSHANLAVVVRAACDDLRSTGQTIFGENITLTATTLAGGVYSFGNLAPGTYTLTETQPAGYLDGAETVGTTFGGTASAALGSNTISTLTITAGSNSGSGYNFGEVLASSLSGTVYSDANNNGVVNGGEALLDAVPIPPEALLAEGPPLPHGAPP
jgi:CheY-like chemotaxis protein